MTDLELVECFKADPEQGYNELLSRYSGAMLRMIRRHMWDHDEAMEVYANVCERFRAHNFQALRNVSGSSELIPWLSVVVANACRDRFRKTRALSMPMSVISQLDAREKLVFKYFYQEHLPHEDIAELISRRHRAPYPAIEVVKAVARINDLLSDTKRWHLLAALRANRPALSLDELEEEGIELAVDDRGDPLVDSEETRVLSTRLSAALERLAPEDRLLIQLRFDHGRTGPQIADLMGFTNHKQVYTRLRTVVGHLRRHMEHDSS